VGERRGEWWYGGDVDRWHLPSIAASGKREPRVLFSRPECRGVLIDLNAGDELGDHRLHESALVDVVAGTVSLEMDGQEVECAAGTLLSFAPGETRSLRALGSSRILLLLAPWPGVGHFPAGEDADPARMPTQATAPPLGS
jgi:quercetin dioxygenase-like cupin family protein